MATNSSQPAPLSSVLAVTFLGSLGTGAITNGFSFIATQGLGYSRAMNLLLALLLGGSYIAGAMLSGPLVRRVAGGSGPLRPRGLLALVLIIITLACQLPILAQWLAPSLLEAAMWILILTFSPLTGVLWPIVEAYLSGGRRAGALRSAIGKFNIVWSGALVCSFWGMAPLLEHHPFMILSLLGVLQLVILVPLAWLPPEPPRHIETDPEPVPAVYAPLLTIFRVLLIASYIVLSALSPLLPIVEESMDIPVAWATPIASAWLASRVVLFLIFERWHGWHGRWWTPWTGMVLMLVGFASCVSAPVFNGAGVVVLLGGLVVVGMGIAILYCGALYYAMSVGNAEVDAGGRHEAMIGVGYTLGPSCGLLGVALGGGSDDAFRVWVIVLIVACVIGATLLGWRLLHRQKRAIIEPISPH